MSNPYPSPGSRPLEQLKVAELRDELRKRGLSLKGVKKDLFERLDEAVRKEQAGPLPSKSEVVGEQHKDAHGVYEPEGEHGITRSADPDYYDTSEDVQDGDGLLFLNDSENLLQDSALIVNNASPYVGASDATPVFMEPRKDAEKLNTGFVTREESKDDVPPINNMNSVRSGALPESIDAEAGDVVRPDNSVLESNAVFPGDDKQTVETVASVPEPDEQSSENKANLPGKEMNDVDLAEDTYEASEKDVVMPESTRQAGGNDGLLFAPELKDINSAVSLDYTLSIHNCAPSRDDATAGETVTLVQKPEIAEVTCQDEMVSIPSKPVKDVANASVPDDLLTDADASLPASSCVTIANDGTVHEAEVLEKTALSSRNVVSSVLEPVKDGGKVESAEDTCLKVESVEDTKQVELLESEEAFIPPSADREAPVMPLGVATLEAVQDIVLPEVQQDMAVPESLQDSVMHEVVQDVVVQEVLQDTEMVEALENPSIKMEVPEMVPETKLPAVSMDTVDHFVGVQSESFGRVHAGNSSQLNEAVRGLVDEQKPNVKLEPVESESRAEGRIVAVENVKVEHQDVKEDLPKSARSFDRSRPKESEYERSRRELGRTSVYGSDRNRTEGRSGRVFREEWRKDPKERELKPVEEFPDRSSQKRKDDGRDTKQQEPAKRMRRWNSGNELVVETARPLTTGSAKEIMSPEIKKEGFAVAPPRLTPKLSGPSRPTPATAKTNSEANGDKRAVPPSARSPTSSLKVERFVRPFTLKAVKDLLSEYGQSVDFWMDQIKTHCYVMYSKVDEAVAARNGLYNKQWPPSFGNLLVADFVDPSEVKIRSDGTFEKTNTPATTPRGDTNQLPQGAQLSGSLHGHSNALAFAPPLRERPLMQVLMKEPEPPVPTLDDLFRKTKAKPHIYYLPLTEEQVVEKLASARNKEQQQARSKLPGRL